MIWSMRFLENSVWVNSIQRNARVLGCLESITQIVWLSEKIAAKLEGIELCHI